MVLKYQFRKIISNPIAVTLILSIFAFLAVSVLYYLFFVYPLSASRQSLSEARNLAISLKLINSKSVLAASGLSSINPSHPEYQKMLNELFSNLEETDNDFRLVKSGYQKFKIRGTSEIKSFENDTFRKDFEAYLKDYEQIQKTYSENVLSLKSAGQSLAKATGYNPYVDLGNMNLQDDKDREETLKRADAAINGLSEVYKHVETLKTDSVIDLKTNLGVSITILKDFRKLLLESDLKATEDKRNEFLNSYNDIIQNSTVLLRSYFGSTDITGAMANQQKIDSGLTTLIEKLDSVQRNINPDPLNKTKK